MATLELKTLISNLTGNIEKHKEYTPIVNYIKKHSDIINFNSVSLINAIVDSWNEDCFKIVYSESIFNSLTLESKQYLFQLSIQNYLKITAIIVDYNYQPKKDEIYLIDNLMDFHNLPKFTKIFDAYDINSFSKENILSLLKYCDEIHIFHFLIITVNKKIPHFMNSNVIDSIEEESFKRIAERYYLKTKITNF